MTGEYGTSGFGVEDYGGSLPPFAVVDAVSATPFTLRVTFSAPLDYGFDPLSNVSNYSIPGLTVVGVVGGTYNEILLSTSQQAYINYVLTVAQAVSVEGGLLAPDGHSVSWTGTSPSPTVLAAGLSTTQVRLVFSQEMLDNTDLTDPASYVVQGLDGSVYPVLLVEAEQAGNPLSVVLTVDTLLNGIYTVTLSTALITAVGSLEVFPKTLSFAWWPHINRMSVPFGSFSGEVSGGILGDPAGLVFFSPALEVGVSGSVIEVDEVSACSYAYETYVFPTPPDPPVLYLWSPQTPSYLGDSLWSKDRLADFRFTLTLLNEETAPTPQETSCVATLNEPFDPNYVAYLNNPAWHLFNGAARTFICTNNLAPIPAGATSTVTLV